MKTKKGYSVYQYQVKTLFLQTGCQNKRLGVSILDRSLNTIAEKKLLYYMYNRMYVYEPMTIYVLIQRPTIINLLIEDVALGNKQKLCLLKQLGEYL